MVSLGNGAVWAEIVATIERDQAARTDAAGSLNDEPAGSTIGPDPSTTGPVAPSELPVAPNLGASEEDGGSEGGDAPSDTALAELGAQLDAADFAEALDVAQLMPQIAQLVEATAPKLVVNVVPNPPSRRGWRRPWRRK